MYDQYGDTHLFTVKTQNCHYMRFCRKILHLIARRIQHLIPLCTKILLP